MHVRVHKWVLLQKLFQAGSARSLLIGFSCHQYVGPLEFVKQPHQHTVCWLQTMLAIEKTDCAVHILRLQVGVDHVFPRIHLLL